MCQPMPLNPDYPKMNDRDIDSKFEGDNHGGIVPEPVTSTTTVRRSQRDRAIVDRFDIKSTKGQSYD